MTHSSTSNRTDPAACCPLAKTHGFAVTGPYCGASSRPGSFRGTGCCFPGYEAIAAKAECARSTVAEALKVLEWAGVLTWQNRIARIQVRERDLFGRWASRWRVIRTSNRGGTQNQDVSKPVPVAVRDPDSPLERALARFAAALVP